MESPVQNKNPNLMTNMFWFQTDVVSKTVMMAVYVHGFTTSCNS